MGETSRRFYCDHPGCDKSYARSEHLNRHRLNHFEKSFHCDRCPKSFSRQDLLRGHKERHEEKDRKTADGLNGRSRKMQRVNNDHNISRVPRYHEVFGNDPSNMAHSAKRTSPYQYSMPAPSPNAFQRNEYPSPLGMSHAGIPPPIPSIKMENYANYDFPRPDLGMLTGQTPGSFSPYVPTPTSPFPDSDQRKLPLSQWPQGQSTVADQAGGAPNDLANGHASGNPLADSSKVGLIHNLSPRNILFQQDNKFSVDASSNSSVDNNMPEPLRPTFGDSLSHFDVTGPSGYSERPELSENFISWLFDSSIRDVGLSEIMNPSQEASFEDLTAINWDDSPKVQEQSDPSVFVPESKRQQILEILSLTTPQISTSQYASCKALSEYTSLYWKHFHPHYPILHKPTSAPIDLQPLLFIAVFTIGSTYSNDPTVHKFARHIHDSLRLQVFGHEDFRPPAKLWVFQSLWLIEMFGKYRSKRKHHELSHIFHGTLITFMRRGTSFSKAFAKDTNSDSDVELRWHKWIEDEGTKRAAFFTFMLDIRHQVLFCHAPSMNAHEMQLKLPCSEMLWESRSALEWQEKKADERDTPKFPSALKSMLMQDRKCPALDALGRYIVLHGLISVTYHMQQREAASNLVSASGHPFGQSQSLQVANNDRDQGGVEPSPGNTSAPVTRASSPVSSSNANQGKDRWIDKLSGAFDFWAQYRDMLLSAHHSSALHPINKDASSLHRYAYIISNTNVIDIQTYSGNPVHLSRPLDATDYHRSDQHVRNGIEDGRLIKALQYAVLVLSEVLAQDGWEANSVDTLHEPFVLYEAALVCWSFGYATKGRPEPVPASKSALEDGREYLSSMKEAIARGEAKTEPRRNCTSGLLSFLACTYDHCSWELLRESSRILQGLVLKNGDTRLANLLSN